MLQPRASTASPTALAVLLLISPAILLAYPRGWDHTIAKEQRFDVGDHGTLIVDVPDADIDVTPGPAGAVSVEIEVASSDLERALDYYERMDFRLDGSRDEVRVQAREPHLRWRWRGASYLVTVRVVVPENFDLEVATDDGNIQISSLRGRLDLRTSDGDIRLDKVDSPRVLLDTSDGDIILGDLHAPDVQIETSDGTIEATGLYGKDIDIRTSDGDILIDALSGGLNAMTNDGDITVQIAELEATSLRTGDGNITVITAANLNANLDLHGEDLILRQADLNFNGDLSEHRARGRLNGGGPRLQASTRDGSITLSTRK